VSWASRPVATARSAARARWPSSACRRARRASSRWSTDAIERSCAGRPGARPLRALLRSEAERLLPRTRCVPAARMPRRHGRRSSCGCLARTLALARPVLASPRFQRVRRGVSSPDPAAAHASAPARCSTWSRASSTRRCCWPACSCACSTAWRSRPLPPTRWRHGVSSATGAAAPAGGRKRRCAWSSARQTAARWGLGPLGATMVGNPEALTAMVEHHAHALRGPADPLALLRGETRQNGAVAGYWAYAAADAPRHCARSARRPITGG
jgi:hypothetical protein